MIQKTDTPVDKLQYMRNLLKTQGAEIKDSTYELGGRNQGSVRFEYYVMPEGFGPDDNRKFVCRLGDSNNYLIGVSRGIDAELRSGYALKEFLNMLENDSKKITNQKLLGFLEKQIERASKDQEVSVTRRESQNWGCLVLFEDIKP